MLREFKYKLVNFIKGVVIMLENEIKSVNESINQTTADPVAASGNATSTTVVPDQGNAVAEVTVEPVTPNTLPEATVVSPLAAAAEEHKTKMDSIQAELNGLFELLKQLAGQGELRLKIMSIGIENSTVFKAIEETEQALKNAVQNQLIKISSKL